MRRRGFGKEDRAVSATLGAILLVAIGVIALVNVRTSYVPIWETGSEAQHMRGVEAQLATLKSDLDRATTNRSSLLAPYPLTLASQRTGVFAQSDPFDDVKFVPRPDSLTYASPLLVIQERNGANLGALGESWMPVGASTIENIESILNFRLKIDEVRRPDTGGVQREVVNVYNALGGFAGSFTVELTDPSGPDFQVLFTIRNGQNEVIFSQPDAIFQGDSISPYWVDLLSPVFPFEPVLRAASPPIKIVLEQVGLNAQYTLAYTTTSATGETILVGGGGEEVPNFQRIRPGGALVYRGQNAHFVDQTFVLEHGALILDQADGQVMRVEPLWIVAKSQDLTTATISLPTFLGPPSALAGEATSSIYVRTTLRNQLVAAGPSITFTIPTEYPDLWADFLQRKFTTAGLVGSGPAPQFLVTKAAKSVTLDLTGSLADPAVNDLQISLMHSQAEIVLGL